MTRSQVAGEGEESDTVGQWQDLGSVNICIGHSLANFSLVLWQDLLEQVLLGLAPAAAPLGALGGSARTGHGSAGRE